MEHRKDLIAVALAAGLLTGLTGVVAAQDPASSPLPVGADASPGLLASPDPFGLTQAEGEASGVVEARTGTLIVVAGEDGDLEYALDDGIETVTLSVGPPWFWGENHPLADLVGQEITVTGAMDDGTPSENASDVAKERASGVPSFEVYTVNGVEVRAPGKPPWAGGPKVVGESHPGYKGWSKNHGPGAKDKGFDDQGEDGDDQGEPAP